VYSESVRDGEAGVKSLSEHMRTGNTRPYRMRRRAEHVDQTRQRIVDAAVELHGTLGPAATTIAGVAEVAGVTRVTVYRHFPNDAALFEACSADWLSRQQLPNPSQWAGIADPRARVRAGLADIYRFYRAGADMLFRINRDIDVIPAARREVLRDRDRQLTGALVGKPTGPAAKRRRQRAAIDHAVSFWTWWSLCHQRGLTDKEAVDVMLAAVFC
jgi:AcrR family transcriptional regulator